MQLIDSHIHMWDPAHNSYDWIAGDESLDRAFVPADLDRGTSGVTGMIFVQAGAADGLAEARWVDSLAGEWPELVGIVADAPLELGAAVQPHLDALRELDKVVGIRRLLQDESLEFFEREDLVVGLRATAKAGLTFDACIRHHQLPALTKLLHKVPELDVVLDHIGKPPVSAGIDSSIGDEWLGQFHELADNQKVFVKLSGVAPEAPGDSVKEQAMPFLLTALETFGQDRCMVGSDWPVSAVTKHELKYDEWFAIVLDGLEEAGAHREQLAWRTAAHFYGVQH
jgi:L-fuconolactonase